VVDGFSEDATEELMASAKIVELAIERNSLRVTSRTSLSGKGRTKQPKWGRCHGSEMMRSSSCLVSTCR
jgi:hypothetical protein